MTATQDLIAAALRLTAIAERNTDDRDEWQHSISEVRELCARAMVQPAATDMAEVPMPEVHDYGYHDSDTGWVETPACDEDDVRIYGDAREAAGYARGLKEAMKDVERYRFLRKDFSPMGLDIDCNHAWAYRRNATLKGPNLDAAIDAALRGEVKP